MSLHARSKIFIVFVFCVLHAFTVTTICDHVRSSVEIAEKLAAVQSVKAEARPNVAADGGSHVLPPFAPFFEHGNLNRTLLGPPVTLSSQVSPYTRE